jgi:hypothetical protein
MIKNLLGRVSNAVQSNGGYSSCFIKILWPSRISYPWRAPITSRMGAECYQLFSGLTTLCVRKFSPAISAKNIHNYLILKSYFKKFRLGLSPTWIIVTVNKAFSWLSREADRSVPYRQDLTIYQTQHQSYASIPAIPSKTQPPPGCQR